MRLLLSDLSQEDGVTLVNKEAEGSSIAIHVSAGKALVVRKVNISVLLYCEVIFGSS